MCLSYTAVVQADCLIKMRTADFKPQFYKDSQNQWQGMSIELAEAVANEAGCRISYQQVTWKRALHLMKYGGLDMLLNVSISKDRQKYLHFIGPLRDETMVLVASNKQADVTKLSDILSLPSKIGVLRGAFYGEDFDKKVRESNDFAAKFEVVNSTSVNIEKLKKNRISGFFNDKYNAVHIIETRLSKKDFKIQPLIVNSGDVYIALSKKSVSDEVKRRLETALKKLLEKGIIDQIIAKYE
jgi:polar amino acid transport system substrate-binding protein